MTKRILVLIFIGLGYANISYGQTVKNVHLAFSANNLGFQLPSFNHMGFVGGVDFWEKSHKQIKQSFGANVSYYYFEGFEHSLMLDATYSLGYQFKFGLQPKLIVDLGYKASILEGNQYVLDNGKYTKSTTLNTQSQINLKLGLGLEYAFNETISIYLEAKIMAYYPYIPKAYIPFNLNEIASLGLKYNFNKTEPSNEN